MASVVPATVTRGKGGRKGRGRDVGRPRPRAIPDVVGLIQERSTLIGGMEMESGGNVVVNEGGLGTYGASEMSMSVIADAQ